MWFKLRTEAYTSTLGLLTEWMTQLICPHNALKTKSKKKFMPHSKLFRILSLALIYIYPKHFNDIFTHFLLVLQKNIVKNYRVKYSYSFHIKFVLKKIKIPMHETIKRVSWNIFFIMLRLLPCTMISRKIIINKTFDSWFLAPYNKLFNIVNLWDY